ncbi:MAG: hypothetical protein LBS98_02775 [Coriobacteriales bacterium]|nr:hypothetical protein [Coriobacteriales bacterium]
MEKLAHGIAVVVGFLVWQLSKNIIVAAVIALIVEGILIALFKKTSAPKERFYYA